MLKLKILVTVIGVLTAVNGFADVTCFKKEGGRISHVAALSLRLSENETYIVDAMACTRYGSVCLLPENVSVEAEILQREGSIFTGNHTVVIVGADQIIVKTKEDKMVFNSTDCTDTTI